MVMKKLFFISMVLLFILSAVCSAETLYSELTQNPTVRYRLFPTETFDTFKLDTSTGLVWQIHCFDIKGETYTKILNDKKLVTDNDFAIGRFTIYPTISSVSLILLDQKLGNMWMIDYSLETFTWTFFPLKN